MISLAPFQIPAAFSHVECERLVALASAVALRPGGLVGGKSDAGIRRAELVWVDDLADGAWVGDRLAGIVAEANRDQFHFDLSEFAESAQVARYGSDKLGHFGWHSDVGAGEVAGRRKLTVVVQLSEPSDYEGGLLETWTGSEPVIEPRGQGDALIFPSFALHRVTPVSQGVRWSLTQWVHGPAFR